MLQSTGMDLRAASQLLTTLPTKTWSIIAVDYNTGHDAADLFKAGVQKQGGTIVQTVFAPQNTPDFGSYITKLSQTPADGLFIVEFGADAVTFVKQANQFDLFSKFKTVFGVNTVTTPLFPTLGPKITGMYDTLGYDPTVDVPANKQFVSAWQAKNGSLPYYVQADTYIGTQALFAAVKKAGSVDPLKVRDALSGLTFDSIVGKVTIRAKDHQILRPSYIGQVVQGNEAGGLAWKIVTEAAPSVTSPSPDPACQL
jgi:ABC-type branched-subunit amino acid transport system substrate-binding protein